ncbi:MAG: LamG-like jellyroll fold domain-containing protein [Pseudomonadota bacterium]
MKRRTLLLSPALAALVAAQPAAAQQYQPDIIELNGNFPVFFDPDPALTIADGGTLEFWVQPDWTSTPDFEPVILSNTGPQGVSYLIAMLPDRQGIVLYSGDDDYVFMFDFSDGKMHHVALNVFEDGLNMLVDGENVGEYDASLADLPSGGLFVGSIDGEEDPFFGAMASLRIWNYVLDRSTVLNYAIRDVVLSDHPELDSLSALSDFNSETLLILEEIN